MNIYFIIFLNKKFRIYFILIVGYGEIYPTTTIGRLAIFILGIWGICNVSLIVFTFSNVLEMDNSENRALNLMIRLKDREKAKKYATNIVSSIFKYKHYKENNPNKNDSISSKMYLIKIRKIMNQFTKINR